MSEALFAEARHSSESVEHYSPAEVVDAFREVVGEFDLDPFSCAAAQGYISAADYFSLEEGTNGFLLPWHGRVLMNPPGGLVDGEGRAVIIANEKHGRHACSESGACGLAPGHLHRKIGSSSKRAWMHAMQEHAAGRATEICFVGYSLQILQTTLTGGLYTSPAPPLDFAVFFAAKRWKFLSQDPATGELVEGVQPPHGSFACYAGPRVRRFREVFSKLDGRVLLGGSALAGYGADLHPFMKAAADGEHHVRTANIDAQPCQETQLQRARRLVRAGPLRGAALRELGLLLEEAQNPAEAGGGADGSIDPLTWQRLHAVCIAGVDHERAARALGLGL